jgi:glycosyltransferase involved in cell wall biosynthesis
MTMEKKIKVLMVVFNLSVANGVSSYVMNYFRNLNHNLIQMDFVIYNKQDTPYIKEIEETGGHVFLIPSIQNIKNHLAESKRIIKEGNYDIVHDNILILSYFIMRYAKAYGVPVRILHSHSSKLSGSKIKAIRNRIFMPLLFKNTNYFIACSRSAGEGMFRKKPFRIVPNVISADKLSFSNSTRMKLRNKFHVNNKFVMGSVGRLSIEKNPIYAFEIALKVKEIIPNFEYWWIGSGRLRQEAELFIKKHHAENFIKLFGNRTDVSDLYQAMDLFFLPSHFEGLPVTGLEAQAAGLPCLVSDTVSNEFVYTNQVFFFSLKNTVESVCGIIQQIKADMGTKPREEGKAELLSSPFSDEDSGQHLISIYRQFLSQKMNLYI